jgi:hypothetical protein
MNKESLLIKVLEMLLNSDSKSEPEVLKFSKDNKKLTDRLIGEYVICRSRNEGINAGYLVDADETGCVLSEARRLWSHEPQKNASWYEGVALYGLSDNSKISVKAPEKTIIEDYSLTLCTPEARKSIEGFKAHEG